MCVSLPAAAIVFGVDRADRRSDEGNHVGDAVAKYYFVSGEGTRGDVLMLHNGI